jgi:hypothetical protein
MLAGWPWDERDLGQARSLSRPPRGSGNANHHPRERINTWSRQKNKTNSKINFAGLAPPSRYFTLLRQKKVPKEKATRSASNSRPSHAARARPELAAR